MLIIVDLVTRTGGLGVVAVGGEGMDVGMGLGLGLGFGLDVG